MNSSPFDILNLRQNCRASFLVCALSLAAPALHADQVQMQNGDRYFGRVTLSTNSLTLQSEILGTVQLPREKVTSIFLGTNLVNVLPLAPQAARPPVAPTNQASAVSPALRKLAAQTNLVQQVQSRFLAEAGPEANAKFAELVTGLTTGTLNINDLRAEARSAAAQVRELRGSLDDESGSSLDLYLSILDRFLKESPAPVATTNSLPTIPKPSLKLDKSDQ